MDRDDYIVGQHFYLLLIPLLSIVIFAGDVSPVEMICHLPAVCEEKSIPYVYVPSKADLGAAMGVKRASVTILIREHEDYKELFDECKADLSALPMPV